MEAFQREGYAFLTFEAYCRAKQSDTLPLRFVILRHDVDKRAVNSLRVAQIEQQMGIRSSFYFRVVADSNRPDIISAIAALGHEVGYHYEDMTIANGNKTEAIRHFEQTLSYFRQFYPVSTICMHGAPTSKWDGRSLWDGYRYQDFCIIGEPYFDVDFSRVFYLTDTGRCWDGYKVSVRDKIPVYQDQWVNRGLVFHSTDDIIRAVESTPVRFPAQAMLTTHPQRWTDSKWQWGKEFVTQNLKNCVKRLLVLMRTR